jgi:hypothetical protein
LCLVCNPNNIRIHVTGDILNLKAPRTAFKDFTHTKVRSILRKRYVY